MSLNDFKSELRWNENVDGQDQSAPWIDRSGMSILAYAVFRNDLAVVKDILRMFESDLEASFILAISELKVLLKSELRVERVVCMQQCTLQDLKSLLYFLKQVHSEGH